MKALQLVLVHGSFKINTPSVIQARESAGKFLEWCLSNSNKDSLDAFTKQLVECLQDVISSSVTKFFCYNKEKLWRNFYILRTSKDFIKQLTDFSMPLKCHQFSQCYTYQHLTDEIFKLLIQIHFQIVPLDEDAVPSNESNALHYTAGYVCHDLQKKFNSRKR